MVVTGDGTVWVSFSDGSVARLAPADRRFELVRRNPGATGTVVSGKEYRSMACM
jgi:hypothetical protein